MEVTFAVMTIGFIFGIRHTLESERIIAVLTKNILGVLP